MDSVHVQGAAQRILPQETVAASTLPHVFFWTSPAAPPRKQVVPPEHSMVLSVVEHGPASSQDFGAQHACVAHPSNSISTSENASQRDGLKFLPVLPVGLQWVHGRGSSTPASESHAAMHAPEMPATPMPNHKNSPRRPVTITHQRGRAGRLKAR